MEMGCRASRPRSLVLPIGEGLGAPLGTWRGGAAWGGRVLSESNSSKVVQLQTASSDWGTCSVQCARGRARTVDEP
eukprot:9405680-Alexandrium_andersonii.AAC.1